MKGMFKKLNLALVGLCVSSFACHQGAAQNGGSAVTEQLFWYQGSCTSGTVEFYKNAEDREARKTAVISDPEVINQIIDLLSRLPVSGEKMIKMGPKASHLKLILVCGVSKYEIHFYNDQIKTPATSFFSVRKPEEKALLKILKQLD